MKLVRTWWLLFIKWIEWHAKAITCPSLSSFLWNWSQPTDRWKLRISPKLRRFSNLPLWKVGNFLQSFTFGFFICTPSFETLIIWTEAWLSFELKTSAFFSSIPCYSYLIWKSESNPEKIWDCLLFIPFSSSSSVSGIPPRWNLTAEWRGFWKIIFKRHIKRDWTISNHWEAVQTRHEVPTLRKKEKKQVLCWNYHFLPESRGCQELAWNGLFFSLSKAKGWHFHRLFGMNMYKYIYHVQHKAKWESDDVSLWPLSHF